MLLHPNPGGWEEGLHTQPGQCRALQQNQEHYRVTHSKGQCSALHPAAAAALFSCTDAAMLIQRGCPAGNLTAFLLIYSVQPVSYWDFGFTFTEFPLALPGAKNKANSSLHSCGQRHNSPIKLQSASHGWRNKTCFSPLSDNEKTALPPLHTTVINVVF